MAAGSDTRSPMSDEHKEALAVGREHGRIVRRYLDALEAHTPRRGRKKDPEQIRARLAELPAQIEEADPLTRLQLLQQRMDLAADLEALDGAGDDLAELEEQFVRVAAAYSSRKGITREAWRAVGVAPAVLKKAGIA